MSPGSHLSNFKSKQGSGTLTKNASNSNSQEKLETIKQAVPMTNMSLDLASLPVKKLPPYHYALQNRNSTNKMPPKDKKDKDHMFPFKTEASDGMQSDDNGDLVKVTEGEVPMTPVKESKLPEGRVVGGEEEEGGSFMKSLL